MFVVQTHLSHGTNHIIAWLPVDQRVKAGSVVSIDKQEGRWRVEKQYAVQSVDHIQRGWGLDLPKTHRTER